MKLERLSHDANVDVYRQSLLMAARQHGLHESDDVSHHEIDAQQAGGSVEEEPSRKRRRNQVDYKQLYEQMKKEGGGI